MDIPESLQGWFVAEIHSTTGEHHITPVAAMLRSNRRAFLENRKSEWMTVGFAPTSLAAGALLTSLETAKQNQ